MDDTEHKLIAEVAINEEHVIRGSYYDVDSTSTKDSFH